MRQRETFHHGDLRTALLDAAVRAIEQDGLDRLSLRELAEGLGVSRGAPYKHFVSKLALLAALAQIAHDQLVARYADVAASVAPADRLACASRAYLAFAAERPQLFQLLFADDGFWQREGGRRPDFHRLGFRVFASFMADHAPGATEATTHRAALAAWAMLHGCAMLRITGRLVGFGDTAALERDVVAMVESLPVRLTSVAPSGPTPAVEPL